MDDTRDADASWVMEALSLYEGALVAYAARLTRDVHAARDVVQEAFLRLCGEDRASTAPHVRAWLYTVCRRLALDAKRRDRRMEPLGETVVRDVAERNGRSEADPADAVAARDEASHVLRLVATLPENQRECLELKFRDGLLYREIAEVTGLTVGNVGFLVHTGLTTLRARLAPAIRRAAGGVQ
jgi:RNA polymerase sigma-70 factor (ECF subfamily)